jgi:monovalent cation/hydrogen antiporter
VNAVEIILILLATAVALAIVAERARLPYPIVLVLGGGVLAFVPGLPRVEIPPNLVLVIFLPPLLFSSAWLMSWRDLALQLRAVGALAIGLVLATMTGVAVIAHALIPGMGWPVAFVLGAIVSPPDAVAATSIMQRLHVPARLVTVLEGESLVNDATGLVAYQVALAAVIGGGFSVTHAVGKFAIVGIGGLAFGLVVGWLVAKIHRRLDDFLIETAITLLTPYVAYIPAEHFGFSGVLASVAAGGYLGWRNPQLFSPLMRLRSESVWLALIFLFNCLVFVLIGLELAGAHRILARFSTPGLIEWCAAIAAATIVIRLVWVTVATYASRSARALTRKEAVVVAWTSMRGIVSLALVLALPETLPDGSAFPFRDVIVLIVFVVIAVTLLGQGLTLPLVIRALGFADDRSDLLQERDALIKATRRALERVAEVDNETSVSLPALETLRTDYEHRLERLQASVHDDPGCRRVDNERLTYQRLRRELIDSERGVFVELRNDATISEEILQRLQRDLDLEALQPLR